MKNIINSFGFWFMVYLIIIGSILCIGGYIHSKLPNQTIKSDTIKFEGSLTIKK